MHDTELPFGLWFNHRIKSKIKPTGVVFLSVHECFSFQDFSFFRRFHKKSSWLQNKSLVFHSSDFTELIKYEEFSGKGNGGFTWRQSFATKVGRKGPNGVSFKASFTVETSLPVVYIDKWFIFISSLKGDEWAFVSPYKGLLRQKC